MNRNHRMTVAILLFGASILSASNSSVEAAATQARGAEHFIDFIGTNVHLDSPVYASVYKTIIKPRLQELGIRYLRDEITATQGQIALMKDLHQSLGIKFNLTSGVGTPAYALQFANAVGLDAVASFEGPNEVDDGPWLAAYGNQWAPKAVAYQQALYQGIKTNPATAKLPVYGLTIVQTADAPLVTGIQGSLDDDNMHSYSGNHNPENTGYGSADAQGNHYGSLFYNIDTAESFGGVRPIVVTETGFSTLPISSFGDQVDEWAAGNYIPRIFFYYFNNNLVRTFSYEFYDSGVSTDPTARVQHEGLIRFDGSPKPAYTALKNIIALLSDPGAPFTPGSLDFTLGGDTNTVQSTLLQKRDGTFYLALWLGSYDYNGKTQTDIVVPPQSVTIQLPSTINSAFINHPLDGVDWQSIPIVQQKITVSVTNAVCLLKLPAASPSIMALAPKDLDFTATARGSNPASKTFTIDNSAVGSSMAWSVDSNQSWVTVTPTSGSANGGAEAQTVTVSVNTNGLSVGKHTATLTVHGPGATNAPQMLTVNLTVTSFGNIVDDSIR